MYCISLCVFIFYLDLIVVLWLSQIGLYEYEGCSVMTSVIQHPYGESDTDKVDSEYSQGMDGYVGYIGPIGCKEGTDCASSNILSNTVISLEDESSVYSNSTPFFMEGVNLPNTEDLKSQNVGSSWIKLNGEEYPTSFITLMRTNQDVGDQVCRDQ